MMQKFTPKTLLPFLTILFFQLQIQAQNGCPGCQFNLPTGLSADTIYVDDFPDGTVNEFYDEDLSFRLPMTTTPVAANDPSIIPGINLDEIKITGIGNLPPGLSFETNQDVYDLPNETDGCAKICGSPLLPGTYMLEIFLEVKISFLTQNTSFQKIMVVNGGTSNNNGFSTTQNIGCGELTVDFSNNIPSNGNGGIMYQWDFGNGINSIDENPVSQTYSTPGAYEVSYQAVVDTIGHFLTNIEVTSSDCNDILSALDLYIVWQDPTGFVILTDHIQNTDPPVQFPVNYEIGPGNYTLTVMDEDSGIDGNNDICGIFTVNQLTGATMSSGGADIALTIIHPVDTVQTTDSIFVYPVPDQPMVDGPLGLLGCTGDTVILASSYDTNNQWFFEGNEIPGASTNQIAVTETGNYYVTYTNEFGCSSSSESVSVSLFEEPIAPEFTDDNINLLSLVGNYELFPNLSLQWYFEDVLLNGETNSTLCIDDSGEYTLEVFDASTGCTNSFTSTGIINEDYFCGEVDVEDLFTSELKIYPNPIRDFLFIDFELESISNFNIYLTDILGRRKLLNSESNWNGKFQKSIDLSFVSAGVYFVEIEIDGEKIVKKVIKQ